MANERGKTSKDTGDSPSPEDAETQAGAEPETKTAEPAGEDAEADAREQLAEVEEPIEAEFEPAESPLKQLLGTSVTMPIVLGLFVLASVLGGLFGVLLGGGSARPDREAVERLVDQRLSDFDARLADLRQAIAESGGEGGGVAAAALTDIESEIAAVRASLGQLRDRVLVVESAAGDDEAAASLSEQLEQINLDLAAVRDLAEEAAATPDANAARIAALASELDAQGAEIAQLSDTSGALARRVTGVAAPNGLASAGAAGALAFASLEEAALSGAPFITEAQAAARYFPDSEHMATLLMRAETGAPTPGELAASFRSVARNARNAEAPAGGGFVERMARVMANIVTVRRLDAPPTDTPADIVVRAQRRLAEDDLAGAAAELDRLDGPAREAAAEWIAGAQARVQIENALEALERSFAES